MTTQAARIDTPNIRSTIQAMGNFLYKHRKPIAIVLFSIAAVGALYASLPYTFPYLKGEDLAPYRTCLENLVNDQNFASLSRDQADSKIKQCLTALPADKIASAEVQRSLEKVSHIASSSILFKVIGTKVR
jgi:hypothetical protein